MPGTVIRAMGPLLAPLGDLALPHFCVLTHSAALCELLCVCWVQVIVSHPANESSLDIAQQDDAMAEDPAVTSQAAGLADVVTPAAGIDKRVAAQLENKVRHGRAAGALQCLRLAQRPACRLQPLLAACLHLGRSRCAV